MNKRHTQRIEVAANFDKNKKNVELSSNLSARRKLINGNSASRRVFGSARRNSVPRLSSLSLQEFDLENEEFDCWEYYSKIEKGLIDVNNEIDEIVVDNSKLESYVKLFNVFYSSLVSGNGNYLVEMSNYWENLIKNLEEISEMNKSVFEGLIKSFIGRLFINICSFDDAKCYYSAMIYLMISILPNRPQLITSIKPFIIRKIIEKINEAQIKKQSSQKKQSKKIKKPKSKKKKSRHDESESESDSDSDSEDEKENSFSGIEKIRMSSKINSQYGNINDFDIIDNNRENNYFEQGEGDIGADVSLILQLKLLNCLIAFCKYLDISNNLAQTGLEGLNELIEGMSDLLICNDNFPKNSQFNNEISNLSTIISRMNDYLINNSPEITLFLQEKGDYSISRIITIGIILLFINIGENRYIKVQSTNGDIIRRFRVARIENRCFEIVIYSSIIFLRRMIPLTLLGSENSLTNNIGSSSNNGYKTQTQSQALLIQKIFNLIREITILFPEISHPNILFIINKIIEIQYGVYSNGKKKFKEKSPQKKKSKKKSKILKIGNYDEDIDEDVDEDEELPITDEELLLEGSMEMEESKSDEVEVEQIGGAEILEQLKKRISHLKDKEFYYIDNVVLKCLESNEHSSENDIFLNDPILGYIFSIYLFLSEKSEARQNVLDQIHTNLIPALIEVTETKNSTKMLLFDILKQTLFNSEENPVGGIKEVNSFISFLSNYRIEYNINTIKEIDSEVIQKITAFPFKFPQLLYRRIISILPIMFHSSKPNYRIIAIDVAGHILQLHSSIELLSVFIQNISTKLPLNELSSKNQSKINIFERQIIIFNRMVSIIFEIFQDNINFVFPKEQSQSPRNTQNNADLDLRGEVIVYNSSRRNSSARQSIEWSGITIDNHHQANFTTNLNFAKGEMAIQLYNLIIFLLERKKDISPNIRIKSAAMISSIVSSACEIYQTLNEEMAQVIIEGLTILLGDFGTNHNSGHHFCYHTKNDNALIPFVQLILDYISDEKAICRKGSLMLWDSLFFYLKLKKVPIPSLKKYLLTIFKNTLTDSSILVRRHSLQSLNTLYNYSPQFKWVSNLWINYGLPTIMDSENFLVDKTTEICYNMLLEQIKKLTEFIKNYDPNKTNINDYIKEINQEYLFSWISLKSQKENQLQIINLYRMCIRSVLRKYPLVLQPLIQFLNIFVEFFTLVLQSNNQDSDNNKEDKFEFPDLPFVIMEEIYTYINQNNVNQTQKDNIFILTQKIYDIMTEYIVGEDEERNPINTTVISENNLLTIINSLFEIFKLFLTAYFHNRKNKNILASPDNVKLISLYEKIIFIKPTFYSRLTKTLIIYQYPAQLLSLSGNQCYLLKKVISSSSLSTIIYILYLWDELNTKRESKKKIIQTNLMDFINSLFKYGNTSREEIIFEFNNCIIPNINNEIKCIETIYLSSIILLYTQLKGGNDQEMLNIRILGELFLLNYTITNMNINNSKKTNEVSLISSIDSNNIEKLMPYLEELYKRFKNTLSEKKNNGDESISYLESNLSILILVLGQASYSTASIAKRVIIQYMVTELQNQNFPLSIKNNILIILHDLYILHTALVDPHLITMFNIIVKERKQLSPYSKDSNFILRKQSLLLLSDLIGQGYIKLRGSYLLRLLHSLVDRNHNIRNIAHGIFERILIKANVSILVQNFVEILCYLNNWIDHPSIKSWNLREKMVSTKHYSGSPEDFDEDEKNYILKFVFNHLSDKQKHETITKIVHDFLALFIDQSSIVTLPESYEHNNGMTLKDALALLYSPDLCIYHKYSKRSYTSGNNNSTRSSSKLENDHFEMSNVTESDHYYDGNKTGTSNVLKELIQASLAIDIIPTLLSLKHLMKQSCSPFIKDIHKCIGELLKDYRNNLSSIIQDTTLIKELEYDFNMGYL
ncbi:non-SMC mitotic condensation complex subunit 1 family protein [Cryptosporidium meleagridis]|uniref:Non-SMC mitotic condensation complex subunit 1 family protein n=1 Tax=Cryptosporidium meleagridis TaxID=93969 RepID=A0A2P4YYT4_9CRYT|nr:non-SMC mitotic condensation complex subunit 1 family protein [Cryptosporidium meleagridis]